MIYEQTSHELAADLEQVQKGWSAATFIQNRRNDIRLAVEAGGHSEAERIAHEIERLQIADDERVGLRHMPAPQGCETWALSAERWAEYLIHGWKCPRYFYPVIGSSVSQALGEAHRVFFVKPWSGSQYIHETDIMSLSDLVEIAA